MVIRTFLAATGLVGAGLVAPLATARAAQFAPSGVDRTHACTRTSSGSCIQGGQFCPQASYGRSGWDAQGRRYVCKGDRTHPHRMRP
jgi:hypothetical protein